MFFSILSQILLNSVLYFFACFGFIYFFKMFKIYYMKDIINKNNTNFTTMIFVKNQEDTIEAYIRSLMAASENSKLIFPGKIIVIDTYSTDDTPKILMNLKKIFPKLDVII